MPKKKMTRKQEVTVVAKRLQDNYVESYRRLYIRPTSGNPDLKAAPDPLFAIHADITLIMSILYKNGGDLLRSPDKKDWN